MSLHHLYNLSQLEREAMEEYINNSLVARIILLSSSLVGAGFFFVRKKDGSLCPCNDYCGLNSITIKNKYPLPSSFEPHHGATIFTKLDLGNTYKLVRIWKGDNWKTILNIPLGHLEYLVMPISLINAPVVQCLLENKFFVKAKKC